MTLQVNYDTVRPKVCAFYAGRAWYAGMSSGEKLGWVLYSQVLSDIENIGKCYQANDPTSEVLSDILDDDGGVLQIPEAGEIVSLLPLGKSLFVFATNGVWYIHNGDRGFTAVDYSVSKVSSVGAIGQKTIVQVEESAYYWGSNGIYVVNIDTNTGFATVKNITDTTIKTFYQSIPPLNKLYAEGTYNGSSRIVAWLHSSTTIESTTTGRHYNNRLLCLDLNLGPSWYIHDIATGTKFVPTFGTTKETDTSSQAIGVVVDDEVVIAELLDVEIDITSVTSKNKEFKFVTLTTVSGGGYYGATWSDFNTPLEDGTQFKDFGANENQAYIITGFSMGGNGPARTKTTNYITAFMKQTEKGFDINEQPYPASSVQAQIRWDFTDREYTSKWSPMYQWYRPQRPYFVNGPIVETDGYPLVITKNKVRGRGKAMQLKLMSEEGKDMKVVGWSTQFIENENV